MISVNAHAYKGRGLTYSRIRVYQYLGSGYVEFRASFFFGNILNFSKLLHDIEKNRSSMFNHYRFAYVVVSLFHFYNAWPCTGILLN